MALGPHGVQWQQQRWAGPQPTRSALMCSLHSVILLLTMNTRAKAVICTMWGSPGRGEGSVCGGWRQ